MELTKQNNFWDCNADRYDWFIQKDIDAYRELSDMMKPYVQGRTVLELATGTGLLAGLLAHDAKSIEATDLSPEMIKQARKNYPSSKLHFSVQDACHLPYADESFPVVLISNALHVIPKPESALREIHRVLTVDGVLLAPTFTHAEMGLQARIRAGILKRAGLPLYHAWSLDGYLCFLQKNGFEVIKGQTLQASLPLTVAICKKEQDRNQGV